MSLPVASSELASAPVLLVAGIRDKDSLGWAAASEWLARDPNNQVFATYRNPRARSFLEAQDNNEGRISCLPVEWTEPSQVEKLGETLVKNYGEERRLAGMVHAVAGTDQSSFSLPAHKIPASVYMQTLQVSALSFGEIIRVGVSHLRPNGGIVTLGLVNLVVLLKATVAQWAGLKHC